MKYNSINRFLLILIWTLPMSEVLAKKMAPWVGVDFKQHICEGRSFKYGPFDYSNSDHRKTKLHVVEEYHFYREIQQLKERSKYGTALGNIDYTLVAFPNHYKALSALTYYQSIYKLEIKKKEKKAVRPAVECYFQRAINFAQKDATLQMLYAVYLKKSNKIELADQHYQKAIQLSPNNLRFHHLYGLFLVDQKKFGLAKKHAELVYLKNYTNQKLKEKLIASGNWD